MKEIIFFTCASEKVCNLYSNYNDTVCNIWHHLVVRVQIAKLSGFLNSTLNFMNKVDLY